LRDKGGNITQFATEAKQIGYTECPGGNVPDFGRLFLKLKYVHRYNPKHLYPKLNGYGGNGERSLKV